MTAPPVMPAPPPAPIMAAAIAPLVLDADAVGIPDSRDLCPETPVSGRADSTRRTADARVFRMPQGTLS